jgi:hypothetical protein
LSRDATRLAAGDRRRVRAALGATLGDLQSPRRRRRAHGADQPDADGTAYVVVVGERHDARYLGAIDLVSGAFAWRHDDPELALRAPEVTASGVYYVTDYGVLVGCDRLSGEASWRWDVGEDASIAADSPHSERLFVDHYLGGIATFAPTLAPPPEEDAIVRGDIHRDCGSGSDEVRGGGATAKSQPGGHFELRLRGRGVVDVRSQNSGVHAIVTLDGKRVYELGTLEGASCDDGDP